MSQIEPVRKYRTRIPEDHRTSLDTRILWLWKQRFGTIQTIHLHSPDILDQTATMLFIQAIIGRDLVSIQQIFQRIEGGARNDSELLEEDQAITV